MKVNNGERMIIKNTLFLFYWIRNDFPAIFFFMWTIYKKLFCIFVLLFNINDNNYNILIVLMILIKNN